MAANRQQGAYLMEFIAGFTTFPAGLILLGSSSTLFGVLLTIAGIGMLVHSVVGFRRIKKLEYSGGS